jgi:DNA (cytosine-5)-methyltransferase 1
MAVYYNECDAFAAGWLRELIKAGLIAPGEVDERSIEDVQPEDVRGFTQCHWFAGIGTWSYALRCAGWEDSQAVWTGSCPCQPFSAAGKRGGFSDKRHLWPAWCRLIEACRPPVIFGEQVASSHSEIEDARQGLLNMGDPLAKKFKVGSRWVLMRVNS